MANLCENIDTHEYINRANGIKCLILLMNHIDLNVIREATRGIANILSSFRYQSLIIETGIPILLSLLSKNDEETDYHIALSLRKLSPNLNSHPVIVYSNGFKAIFGLLNNGNINTRKQTATALRDICANPDYKIKCMEENGIEAIIELSRQTIEQLQALAFSSFLFNNDNNIGIPVSIIND